MILKFIYELLENISGIEVQYNDGMEYLVGTILAAIAVSAIGSFIFKIAYRQTGKYARFCGIYDPDWMRCAHYGIRIALLAIAIIVVYPILQAVINISVPSITDLMYNFGEWYTKQMIDTLLNSLNKL